MQMNACKLFFVLLIFTISACTTFKPSPIAPVNEVMPVEKREVKTLNVSSFNVKGAMAVKSKSKAWTASVDWTQSSLSQYQIRLFGPLGGGSVIVERKGGQVVFRDGAKVVTSNNADELLAKQTGIRLPVSNLYYWVRGLPAPSAVQNKTYDEYNHLKQIIQGGYTVNYLAYTSKNGVDLPSKIQLTGNGVSMKFVIKNWALV